MNIKARASIWCDLALPFPVNPCWLQAAGFQEQELQESLGILRNQESKKQELGARIKDISKSLTVYYGVTRPK